MTFLKGMAVTLLLLSTNAAIAEEDKRTVLWAYIIVECRDGLNDEVKIVLAELRRRGEIPPYSDAWCIKQGVVPWNLRKDDKES
jgi:hypothetical protein